jgi:ABC-2 type transport system ATP-binding protein
VQRGVDRRLQNQVVSVTRPAPAVLVDDLVVRFGDLVAVNGVSFAVEQGEVFGLLGPNGAGKTTTLRVLTTLLRPSAGRALVAGRDTVAEGLHGRSSIGYVPQAISVDAALTGIENLEFYARVGGIARRQRASRIAQAVETMGLGPFAHRLARQLSGGMLRRLEVATALLTRPRVLFLWVDFVVSVAFCASSPHSRHASIPGAIL